MNYFNLLFLIALSNLSVAQKVGGVFDKPSFIESFDRIFRGWKQKHRVNELFQTMNGDHQARRLARKKKSIIVSIIDVQMGVFQIKSTLPMDCNKSSNGNIALNASKPLAN